MKYATPSEYFDALHKEEIQFPLIQRDFLPYGPTLINWWNGYYSSRPLLKRACRQLDELQRAAEVAYTWARTVAYGSLPKSRWDELYDQIESVRHVQGIMQHHDAITGTMREHVLHDYFNMIGKAVKDTLQIVESVTPAISGRRKSKYHVIQSGDAFTIEPDVSKPHLIMLTNSLAWERKEIVQLFVNSPFVEIFDEHTGKIIQSAVLPPTVTSDGWTSYRLYFQVDVDPIGFQTMVMYYSPQRTFEDVVISESPLWNDHFSPDDMPGIKTLPPAERVFIENNLISVGFDELGNAATVTQKHFTSAHHSNGTFNSFTPFSMKLQKEYWVYKSDSAWDNHYTFKALDDGTTRQSHSKSFFFVKSILVQELVQRVDDNIWQRVSLRFGEGQIGMTDIIGPPGSGTNYVSRYITSLPSDGHFYTDDSGLEILQRTYNPGDIYSGNYYPMQYSAFLRQTVEPFESKEEAFHQFTIVTDRTHGVTSPSQGTLDLMLHRNTLQPHGNGETMNDQERVEIQSWLLVTNEDNYRRQQIAMCKNFALQIVGGTGEPLVGTGTGSFVRKSFPQDVFLMNLDYYDKQDEIVVIRVNNLRQRQPYELYEPPKSLDGSFSYVELDQSVSLQDIFNNKDISLDSLEERSLSLNQPASSCKRHHWHDTKEDAHNFQFGKVVAQEVPSADASGFVELPPLAIRSFFAHFSSSK